MLGQFRSVGWYPDIDPPAFNQHGGQVGTGFALVMSASAGTTYYTLDGSDPRTVTGSNVATDAIRYTVPVPLPHSVTVKARALSGSTWSALHEATFAVGPVAENLRISEIMYHPDDPNTEFIELTNIGDETINLAMVAFTNGIDFVFPSLELAPGDFTVVVEDLAAFETCYGMELPVAGQYTGRLANGGERIELQDAAGQIIHDFRFRDDWYDSTDGEGFSLTVQSPTTVDPSALGDEAAWRPSTDVGGSPGLADASDTE